MNNKFEDELKSATFEEISLLKLFIGNHSLYDIASSNKIEPVKALYVIRKAIGKLSFAAEFITDDKEKKILKISDSDLKSFSDSATILYRLKIIRKAISFTIENV